MDLCENLNIHKKVQVGKDQEKAQSEKDSHSKNRGGKKPNQQSGTYTMKHIVSRSKKSIEPVASINLSVYPYKSKLSDLSPCHIC